MGCYKDAAPDGAVFVDSFLASATGKEFTGEQGGYKMLLVMSSPWYAVITEEQAFLPPSVRPPYVECWLPFLLREDDFLDAVFVILKNFQAQLKKFLLELVEPDYENQIITMKRELLSESFYKAVSEREYLFGVRSTTPKIVAAATIPPEPSEFVNTNRESNNNMTTEAKAGKIYCGKVVSITESGALVEFLPGKKGICHIDELANFRVKKVEDIVKVGEEIRVKCLGLDELGCVKLSRRAAME